MQSSQKLELLFTTAPQHSQQQQEMQKTFTETSPPTFCLQSSHLFEELEELELDELELDEVEELELDELDLQEVSKKTGAQARLFG